MVPTYGYFLLKALHFHGQKLPLLHSETGNGRTFSFIIGHQLSAKLMKIFGKVIVQKENLYICIRFEPLTRIIPREVVCLPKMLKQSKYHMKRELKNSNNVSIIRL